MTRQYDPGILAEPRTLATMFTSTGRVRGRRTRASFQCAPTAGGWVNVWTIGPLGWGHDFATVSPETSFDDAVRQTYLPGWYGWT